MLKFLKHANQFERSGDISLLSTNKKLFQVKGQPRLLDFDSAARSATAVRSYEELEEQVRKQLELPQRVA